MVNSHLSGFTFQLICCVESTIKCSQANSQTSTSYQTPLIQQEMAAMRSQMTGQINVEVDAKPQVDLSAVMAEIREQYENAAVKSNKDLQVWFQGKVRLDQNPGGDIY